MRYNIAIGKILRFAVPAITIASTSPWAQEVTQAQKDSGWVSLFNGYNLDGFYTITGSGAPREDLVNNNDGIFYVRDTDKVIRSDGATTTHLITKKKFSHYRVRVSLKYDKLGEYTLNCGLLYHTRIEAPRLYGNYPRSIEFQGQKRGMGEIWTISNVFVTTTKDPDFSDPSGQGIPKYKLGGQVIQHGGANDPGRQCYGSENPFKDGEWNTLEALVRGSDSSHHIVNGTTVFRCTKIRWSDANKADDMSTMLDNGSLALQVEGNAPSWTAPISYKEFMIMELDPVSGNAINAKPIPIVKLTPPQKQSINGHSPLRTLWNFDNATPVFSRYNKHGVMLSGHGVDGKVTGVPAPPISSEQEK